MMRIYTKAGDLAFKTFSFPDGQPHFTLETYERDFTRVTIETAIKSPLELFQLGLAVDVLRNHGYSEINLDVRYLLGARMDRAIDTMQPHTLQSIARYINSLGFAQVRILDVHSNVATKLIRNSSNILPLTIAAQVYHTLERPIVACPDKGASDRVDAMFGWTEWLQCFKDRDPQTGALSGFRLYDPNPFRGTRSKNVLVVDDICDAGGTFVGLAKVLRAAGAEKVFLYVTHGIFSKGLKNLCSVDHVFTTDSYWTEGPGEFICPENDKITLTVVPISMEKL
jgi:ribose-phosphate pyrophosphokinase